MTQPAPLRSPQPVTQVSATVAEPTEIGAWVPLVQSGAIARPPFDRRPHTAAILHLQRVLGNQAVQRYIQRFATNHLQRDEAKPAPNDAEVEKKMRAALQTAPLGQQALAIQAKYAITLTWADSGTAGFDEEHNQCFINRTMDPAEVAAYFVHEMHHADEFMSGRSPAVKNYNDSQEQAYIQRMVNEEIAGTVLQFEAALEMGAVPAGSGVMAGLMPQYKRVRQYWIDETLKTKPGDRDGAVAVAKEKCQALVSLWIKGMGGNDWPKLAANQLESYEMYYRRLFRQSRVKK